MSSPIGPQMSAQNAVATMTAMGESPVFVTVDQWLDDLTHDRLGDREEHQHDHGERPSRNDRDGQQERRHGRHHDADERNEAHDRGQDSP